MPGESKEDLGEELASRPRSDEKAVASATSTGGQRGDRGQKPAWWSLFLPSSARPMGWFVCALAIVFAAVWARVWTSARAELEEAVMARSAGDVSTAITHYQYAMRWYTPGASAPVDAANALDEIATEAAAAGDRATALRALRRLRGGVLATRSLYSPFGDRLDAVNKRLAKHTAEAQLALGQSTIRGRTLVALERDHLTLLQRDPTPAAGWSLMVLVSFLGWLGSVFMTLGRGLDREARLVRPVFFRWGLTALGCFALWLFALSQA